MKIVTTRFGELDVADDLIVHMTKPILGFEQYRTYVVVETEDFEPFKWFQSIECPELAFVVVNPMLFFPDYVVEVNPKEIEELRVDDVDGIVTYAIVSIPADFTLMTANLQGPVLINTKTNLAKQLVLVNSRFGIRHRLLDPRQAAEAKQGNREKTPAHA